MNIMKKNRTVRIALHVTAESKEKNQYEAYDSGFMSLTKNSLKTNLSDEELLKLFRYLEDTISSGTDPDLESI